MLEQEKRLQELSEKQEKRWQELSEKRWQELSEKLQNQDDKLEIVLNNTTGDQMISETDFRGLNFDDVLGKWLVCCFFCVNTAFIA